LNQRAFEDPDPGKTETQIQEKIEKLKKKLIKKKRKLFEKFKNIYENHDVRSLKNTPDRLIGLYRKFSTHHKLNDARKDLKYLKTNGTYTFQDEILNQTLEQNQEINDEIGLDFNENSNSILGDRSCIDSRRSEDSIPRSQEIYENSPFYEKEISITRRHNVKPRAEEVLKRSHSKYLSEEEIGQNSEIDVANRNTLKNQMKEEIFESLQRSQKSNRLFNGNMKDTFLNMEDSLNLFENLRNKNLGINLTNREGRTDKEVIADSGERAIREIKNCDLSQGDVVNISNNQNERVFEEKKELVTSGVQHHVVSIYLSLLIHKHYLITFRTQ
jgi:hypothetical protein